MNEFEKELEDYFCRFTFGQFVTLILLEVVTLFFVFYLGARYGPDLMGRRQERTTQKASALPPDDSRKVEDLLSNPPTNYSYPEALGDGKGKNADVDAVESKSLRVKPSGMTAKEADLLIKKGTVGKEAPPPEVSGQPEELKEQEVVGAFSIQVGSYQSEDEANQMRAKWKKKGYSAFVTSGEVPGRGIWYRVRIGKFGTKSEANAYLDKLKTREKVEALVVSSKS